MEERGRERRVRVRVEMRCDVAVSADMRWMHKMLSYISYFSSHLLRSKLPVGWDEREKELLCVVEEVSERKISLCYYLEEEEVKEEEKREKGEKRESKRKVDEQTYTSSDGLFFSPALSVDREVFHFDIPPPPLAELFTVCQMCWNGSLCPGVVVLIGSQDICAQRILVISDFLTKISSSQVTEMRVSLQDETDLPVVFGDPASPVLGGLPLFIEQITNPLMNNPNCGLVIADVSVYGQYALRELLESGQSETHKNQIRKEKILFILTIPSSADVTSQISSRAHWIWQ